VCAPSEAGEIGDDMKGRELMKILMQPMHPVNGKSSNLGNIEFRANMFVSWPTCYYASQIAGTGGGREEYAPSRQVSFDPEAKAVESILIKYEWRATLCRMNVIHCGTTYGRTHNRLWDDYGFAPRRPSGREASAKGTHGDLPPQGQGRVGPALVQKARPLTLLCIISELRIYCFLIGFFFDL
jgi:hypothetical protein